MFNKKNFYIFLISIFSTYCLLWLMLFIINPMFKFNNNFMPNNKIGYSPEFSKFSFNKLKKNKLNLVFGTSRSHYIDSEILEKLTLNLHSVYGNPIAVYNFLTQLNRKQIQNINQIYYLVDVHILTNQDKKFLIDYDKIDLSSYFLTSFQELKNIYKSFNISYYMTDFGTPKNIKKDLSVHPKEVPKSILKVNNQKVAIKKLIQIQKFCKKNNIEIVFFTPTLPKETLKLLDINKLFNTWKLILNSGLENVFQLWWVDNVSELIDQNGRYLAFRDMSHLNYNYQKNIVQRILIKKEYNQIYYIENQKDLKKYFNELKKKIFN